MMIQNPIEITKAYFKNTCPCCPFTGSKHPLSKTKHHDENYTTKTKVKG